MKSEGDKHTPSTTHIWSGFLHHGFGEAETMKGAAGFDFKGAELELLEFRVGSVESHVSLEQGRTVKNGTL